MSIKKRYVARVLMLTFILAALCVVTGLGVAVTFAADGQTAPAALAGEALVGTSPVVRWDLCIAIAVSIGLPCLAAGYAVAQVGAAALGAASEKPELLTRSLLFVALAEGIAIYGLLVAILLYTKF